MTPSMDSPKAEQAKESAKQGAAEVADTAREERDRLVGKLDTHARNIADKGRERAEQRADSQLSEVASSMRSVSEELRTMSQGSERPDGLATQLASDGADSLSSLADRLDNDGVRGLMDDVRRLGRERPGAFVGVCFAAGLAIGRVVRNADNEKLKEAASNSDGSDGPSVVPAEGVPAPTGDASQTPVGAQR